MASWAPVSEEEPRVFRLGGISYLRIPASEPRRSAAFYEAVFGWRVDADRDDPSFEDGTGHVIGHLVADLPVAGEAGVLPYVFVERQVIEDGHAGTEDRHRGKPPAQRAEGQLRGPQPPRHDHGDDGAAEDHDVGVADEGRDLERHESSLSQRLRLRGPKRGPRTSNRGACAIAG
jgi:catechol 2,3-dioxygenase-like lactoylglutathione lyase family enzyme